MIGRGCERPLFLRIGLVIRGRRIGQEGGGHLVGEAAEVIVDLDFESREAGGVAVQLIEPLLSHGIDLLAQLRRDIRQGRNEWAGLGLTADLHGRLRVLGYRQIRGYAIQTGCDLRLMCSTMGLLRANATPSYRRRA